jgi:hypothetical protein
MGRAKITKPDEHCFMSDTHEHGLKAIKLEIINPRELNRAVKRLRAPGVTKQSHTKEYSPLHKDKEKK